MKRLEIIDQPKATKWLFSNQYAAFIWLVVRVWLGYEWIKAGWGKLFGAESKAFWNTGLGVKGFAEGAIASHGAPHGAVSYGWWVAFLRNFVVPNYSWIGKLVALGEFFVGVALIVGFMTGLTALLGLLLNFTYVYSGTVSTNPTFIILGVLLVTAWRISGLYGADYFVLPWLRNLLHKNSNVDKAIGKLDEPIKVEAPQPKDLVSNS